MRRALNRAAAGLAVTAALLTSCTRQAAEPDASPEVDVLGSMLAGESEINTLLQAEVRQKTALRSPMKNDNYEPISRPECMVALGNAMDWVYQDSGYLAFRETQLADDTDALEVDQAVARFDTSKAAQAVVTNTIDIWQRCSGEMLTFSYDGGITQDARLLAAPSIVDGVNVTHDQPQDPTDRITHRAILAVDNLVVDLRISGDRVDDRQTAQLAKIIAGRTAL